jgi:hypothetical protein
MIAKYGIFSDEEYIGGFSDWNKTVHCVSDMINAGSAPDRLTIKEESGSGEWLVVTPDLDNIDYDNLEEWLL